MNEPMDTEAKILAELGIDKGKMLGITREGLRLEQDASGALVTVELVGRFDQATANRLIETIHHDNTKASVPTAETISDAQMRLIRLRALRTYAALAVATGEHTDEPIYYDDYGYFDMPDPRDGYSRCRVCGLETPLDDQAAIDEHMEWCK